MKKANDWPPDDSTTPLDDLRSLSESVAVMRSDFKRLRIDGADAADYLHRRLSVSVKGLEEGEGTHALQLDAEGRMQFEILLYRLGESFHALVPAGEIDRIREIIEKYVIMDDVAVSRPPDNEVVFALAGPRAPAALSSLIGRPERELEVPEAPWRAMGGVKIGEIDCRIFRDGRWRTPYYHIAPPMVELKRTSELLLRVIHENGGGFACSESREVLRIEQGVTRWGLDATAATIPIEAGLMEAIDFDKGCFPGQEVLATIRNLGHPARVLTRLETEGEHAIEPGAPLIVTDGEAEAGHVTSSATLPGLGRTVGLGYLKWSRRDAPQATVQSAGGKITVRLSPCFQWTVSKAKTQP